MLEKYKDEQPILYNLLINSIRKNKLSHAYLFETNDNPNSLDIIYSFVKEILCPKNISCDKCNICSRIDNGNYLDIKFIEPDGLQIKKEQMTELQDEFSKIALESDKKIYIINECDKMNQYASNSILKFLEEPVEGVIAILVTNNINRVLKTIVSRCQVISLNKNNYDKKENSFENIALILNNSTTDIEKFLSDEKQIKMFDSVLDFINFYEDNKKDTIVYVKKMWHEIFNERIDNLFAMDVMINFYYDVFKYKINGQVNIFVDKIDLIKKISNNDVNNILYKINLLIELKKLISNNLNIDMLIDYMILKLESR